MEKNVNIFIGAYKSFEPLVSNDIYKIVVGNHKIKNNSNLEVIECGNEDDILDDKFYSEYYMLKSISERDDLPKYVGFCHYNKYFEFLDNVPDMDVVFNEASCVIASPVKLYGTVKEQYGLCHNAEDLEIIEDIIRKRYKSYCEPMELFLNGKVLIPYNMFIMKRSDFKKCCKFVLGVLEKYIKIVGTDISKRIEDNKDKYLKKFSPNDTPEYQYRIGGYLAERLTNIFIMKNFKQIQLYSVVRAK